MDILLALVLFAIGLERLLKPNVQKDSFDWFIGLGSVVALVCSLLGWLIVGVSML